MFSEDNIKKLVPTIIDTYCELFGEEYREVISQRLNDLNYFVYLDTDSLENYYNFLLKCKTKELSIKFLELIGVDTSENKDNNFADDLDEELNDLIENYFGGYTVGLQLYGNSNYKGALSFRPENINHKDDRIKFLNFLRNNSTSNITIDNLNKFYQTEEFKELSKKIDLCINSYDKILLEFENYKKSLEPYMKYIMEEKSRKENIFDAKANEFLSEVYSILPAKIIIQMNKHKIKIANIFSNYNMLNPYNILEEKSNIEYFSESFDKKLNDPNYTYLKKRIKLFRNKYFESLGFDLSLYNDSYEDLIKDENLEQLIPSEELTEKIAKLRLQKLMEAQEIYYSEFNNSYPFSFESAYEYIQNETFCINQVITSDNSDLISTFFFTFRNSEGGMLDYCILHEFCHAIESSVYNKRVIVGFDNLSEEDINPYDKQKRKYERLNENITDIFAILALNNIRQKNLYLLDRENQTASIENIKKNNTSPLTKNLLFPFVKKYMNQIVNARISGNADNLFCIIGKENFEDLNDAINKLDYLLSLKRLSNIEDISQIDLENNDNPDILEIIKQVKRVEEIYVAMDNYKNNLELGLE